MTVLLIGLGNVQELTLVADAVEAHGGDAILCDVRQWPSDLPLTINPTKDGATLGTIFNYSEITGVYVMSHHLFKIYNKRFKESLEKNLLPVIRQLREYRAMFESLCQILEYRGATVIPLLRNHNWQGRKPWQLFLYDDEKIPTPKTIFSNERGEVETFFEQHGRVVYKPVSWGGVPHELSYNDLDDDRIDKLATAPVQFQEFIDGEDLRVYVLSDEVIGSIKYSSQSFSFKVDMKRGDSDEIDVEDATISEDIEATAIRAAQSAGLIFGAADIRRRPDGTHVLLELNETPRIAPADIRANQDIADSLAKILV
ncbi:RimK family alpha-L-glutamate ligase [Halococcus sp. IIIV-5B]|uniref:ATP-grasp domain-containing protein n=1 Tax=Halococcus sp. IIIV-5B TaxID=2321230 RepID=UPI000E744ECF|nr:hypothetical protein [Halococcus sp. IIIV-5B]RJS96769.1 hypothetical protein D3261_18830 [Halococcus sp. IIIV-5B]